jgi:hypothetical protein
MLEDETRSFSTLDKAVNLCSNAIEQGALDQRQSCGNGSGWKE